MPQSSDCEGGSWIWESRRLTRPPLFPSWRLIALPLEALLPPPSGNQSALWHRLNCLTGFQQVFKMSPLRNLTDLEDIQPLATASGYTPCKLHCMTQSDMKPYRTYLNLCQYARITSSALYCERVAPHFWPFQNFIAGYLWSQVCDHIHPWTPLTLRGRTTVSEPRIGLWRPIIRL